MNVIRTRKSFECDNKLIASVTLNPALDHTFTVQRLVVEDVNRWIEMRRDPGGKGVGVSRVVHKLGGRTVAYGLIGGPAGHMVEGLLAKERVACDFVHIRRETRTNIIVTDLMKNVQTKLVAPGPLVSERELDVLRKKLNGMEPRPSFLVMSGSVPPGVPDDIYAELIRTARAMGIKTVLDSDRVWLREGLKEKPFMVKPNRHEASRLLGKELETEDDLVQATLDLCSMGVEVAVISRGSDGVIASDGRQVIKAVPPAVQVRSTVGAGDSTVAGLVVRICQGDSLAEACRLGVAAGSASVMAPGTQLCRKADVEKLAPGVKVERLR